MKIFKYMLAAAAVLTMVSCGISNRHDKIEELEDDQEEWTVDQTNEAIDIYIEGLQEMAALYEEVSIIEEKLQLQGDWEYKAKKKAYWKDRKDDIKEASKRLKETQKEIRKKYEKHDD